MIRADSDPLGAVEAAGARGAAATDPVRWCVIEGLARRAAALQGPARQVLLRRLEVMLAEHAGTSPRVPLARSPAASQALVGLSDLANRLGRVPVQPASTPQGSRAPAAPAPQPLRAVAAFKGTWSRLRAEQRLRQALAQVPLQAGPLNSSHVVHRALQMLHDLSPAYLDAFMAHVDTLLALEQANGGDALSARTPPRLEAKRPPGTLMGSSRPRR